MHSPASDWQEQCERCLYYWSTANIDEHREVCGTLSKAQIKMIQSGEAGPEDYFEWWYKWYLKRVAARDED